MHSLETTIKNLIKEAVREVLLEEAEKGTFHRVDNHGNQKKMERFSRPSNNKDPLAIIRPKQLSELLSVSVATLYRMEKEGRLPTKIRFSGRSVGWRYGDIEEWLVENEIKED